MSLTLLPCLVKKKKQQQQPEAPYETDSILVEKLLVEVKYNYKKLKENALNHFLDRDYKKVTERKWNYIDNKPYKFTS